MKIIIEHSDELRTSRVLRAIADYYDGYCLPETVEPKKFQFLPKTIPEKILERMNADYRGNVSIQFYFTKTQAGGTGQKGD